MTEDLKAKLRSKKRKEPIKQDYLSTGSTLLNLACSGKTSGALCKGDYYLLVGDSASGKTFIAMTVLAEACLNPAFAKHRLIFDDGEGGAKMDRKKFFGKALVDRLESPSIKGGKPYFSRTVEEFYYHLDDAIKAGPCIYVLDSMDSLDCEDDQEKFQAKKTAHKKGKKETGSYGVAKAKANSQGLRRAMRDIKDTDSILIIISQAKVNLGFGFSQKTRAGGISLTFYTPNEIWFSIKGSLKKSVNKKPRKIGSILRAHVRKNRQTGWEPIVDLRFYPSFGFDDTGSCIEYLIDEGHWKEGKGGIEATEFDVKLSSESLIQHIEENNLEKNLQLIVAEVWADVEAQCSVERKKRYE